MELCRVSLFGQSEGVKREKVQIELFEDKNTGQADKPFKKARLTATEGAGNTVEFIRYHITEKTFEDGIVKSFINITNNYRLIGIYVYDGELNYE